MKRLIFSLVLALIVLASSCSNNRVEEECDRIEWVVTGVPLNGKGLKRLSGSYYSDWLELPYKVGDTVPYYFDDERYIRLLKSYKEAGGDSRDREYVIKSIVKKCKKY